VAETQTTVQPDQQEQLRHLPPFKVVLHNDDVNTFDHVIFAILRLTPLEAPEAVAKTIEAHETGQAVLLITNQERAELYVEQFASLSLTVTCEPDE
jgi:ATP-dependent Clp protease adaptor protein ClpS